MAKTPATYDTYLAEHREFEKGLPTQRPEWLERTRERALSRFRELGFPTARRGNEAWKYTNVAPIANASFSYPLNGASQVEPADLTGIAPWDDTWINLVFVNGRYSQALSGGQAAPDGARVTSLGAAIAADGGVIEEHLAQHATFEHDGFTALNTAFIRDGALVHLPDGEPLQSPLHLIFVTTDSGQPAVTYPRTLVVAGAHSKVTVVETYVSLSATPNFTNAVTEIVVGDGAQVEHYRLLLESADAFHVGTSRVYQGRDSTFASTSFARGVAIGRHDMRVLLDAPGSSCLLRGLYVTSGTQHMDNYLNIDHAKPHTTSRLKYKGILDGASRAVFGGMVLVRPGAVKADAQQTDKNLILSDEAELDSKPGLEIYADDVQCGHGATAGSIAEDAMFYMRSRGLDSETATAYLIRGFASEITDAIDLEPVRACVEAAILGALPRIQAGRGS